MIATGICKEGRGMVLLSNFVVWRERCNRIFNEKSKTIEELVSEVRDQWRALNSIGARQ